MYTFRLLHMCVTDSHKLVRTNTFTVYMVSFPSYIFIHVIAENVSFLKILPFIYNLLYIAQCVFSASLNGHPMLVKDG